MQRSNRAKLTYTWYCLFKWWNMQKSTVTYIQTKRPHLPISMMMWSSSSSGSSRSSSKWIRWSSRARRARTRVPAAQRRGSRTVNIIQELFHFFQRFRQHLNVILSQGQSGNFGQLSNWWTWKKAIFRLCISISIYIIKIGRFVCLSVRVYRSSDNIFGPIGMKLGIDTYSLGPCGWHGVGKVVLCRSGFALAQSAL